MGVHGNHLRHSTQRAPQRLHRPFKRVQGSRAVKIAQMLAHDGHAVLQPANGILQPGAQRKNVGSFCRRAPHGPRSIPAGTAHHHGPSVHDAGPRNHPRAARPDGHAQKTHPPHGPVSASLPPRKCTGAPRSDCRWSPPGAFSIHPSAGHEGGRTEASPPQNG